MSVNNAKKLSKIASGNEKNLKKSEKMALFKPIKQTKVDEETKQSLTERFTKAIEEETARQNMGEQNLLLTEEIKNAPKLNDGAIQQVESQNKEISSVDELTDALYEIEESFKGVTDEDYIKEDYKVEIPGSLGLSKMEVPTLDENKLRSEVEEAERKNTEQKKDSERKKAEEAIFALSSLIENKKESASEGENKINQIYDDYKLQEESEALRRGLARSSVALLALDSVEKARASELSSFAKSLQSSISETEKEIALLQSNLSSALENLDLELSVKINEKIEEKIQEFNKKREEAIEFNNNVQKLEAEYQLKKSEKIDEAISLEEQLKEKYEGSASRDKGEKMFALAHDYFSKMDKTVALKEIIASPELATVMGDYYYDLYYAIMRGK